MKQYTIDYAKWRSGKNGANSVGEGVTELLNHEGYMCCLGQICREEGISEKDILGVGAPFQIEREEIPYIKKWGGTTKLAKKAMQINDLGVFPIVDRIKMLAKLFLAEGVELKFMNVPPKLGKCQPKRIAGIIKDYGVRFSLTFDELQGYEKINCF